MEENSLTSGNKARNRELLKRLLEAARKHGDLYGVVRLLIPKRDVERQRYNMKENGMAAILLHALRISPDSKDGVLLNKWKQTNNECAGDFAQIAMQVISKRQCVASSKVMLADFNDCLDRLCQTKERTLRVKLFGDLIERLTTTEMKWFFRIVLKELKIGLGESTILNSLHEDARALMATCVDLKLVCSQLYNQNAANPRKEMTVGKALKSQHSKRMNSIEATWTALQGRNIVAECKFDGDRMQVHRDGAKIWFWSRNGKEHEEYKLPLGDALRQCLSSERCVLDGELLVWDIDEDRFKARTKMLNHDAARAARKGFDTKYRVCYVIFDIIYEGEYGCIMHFPLKKRQEILRFVVQSDLSPQIFSVTADNMGWSILPTSLNELKEFFWTTVETGNEGIVVKDLLSEWCPDNRDGRWCKIKPDYVFLGNDLDLLIIGGYFGTGSQGGKIASYLLALVDAKEDGKGQSRFISVCRCGKGLSEEEFAFLESKLSPYFVKNEKGGAPPSMCGYMVTKSRYESPDVWISKPEMSIVLQISSEKRVYPSQTFKAGWTFRFPRVVKVRYDKCWSEALKLQEFEEVIKAAKEHGNSLLHGPQKYSQLYQTNNNRSVKRIYGPKRQLVLPHLQTVDVSNVQQVARFFDGHIFYFLRSSNMQVKQDVLVEIKRCGGRTVPNFLHCVTNVIAVEEKGFQFRIAVENNRDVLCFSWLIACLHEKRLLPISPRHYLYRSQTTIKKFEDEVDEYGDPYFEAVNEYDLAQVLNMVKQKGVMNVEQRKIQSVIRNLGDDWRGSILAGCTLYFHTPVHSVNFDSQRLAMMVLKRLELETGMLGSSTSCSFSKEVTHVIVYTSSSVTIPIKRIHQSFSPSERELLCSFRKDIVSHLWLEECVSRKEKISAAPYLLNKETDMVTRASRYKSSKLLGLNGKVSNNSGSADRNSKPRKIAPFEKFKSSQFLPGQSWQVGVDNLSGNKWSVKGTDRNDNIVVTNSNIPPEGVSLSSDKGQPRVPFQERVAASSDCQARSQYRSEDLWGSQCLQDIAQLYLGWNSQTFL